jgi:uncharacterized repeat protein (TIGR03803 family)
LQRDRFAGGFDGAQPAAALLDVDGTLYGTTSNGGPIGYGTIYSITTGGSETVLYRFAGDTDGRLPYTPLTNVSGTLYGTTGPGGYLGRCTGPLCGRGTVFELTP